MSNAFVVAYRAFHVSWCYGGMVITNVAGRVGERIGTLFYLDAAVPENGQSAFDVVGHEVALGWQGKGA
jgi:hypothetical protein